MKADEAVTQRIAALEAEILQQKWQLELAASAAGVGFFRWNRASDELWTSPEFSPLFGFQRDEPLTGSDVLGLIHPDDLDAVEAAMEKARLDRDEYGAEFRILTPSGQIRWLAGRGRWSAGLNGESEILSGANWDISAIKSEADRVRRILDGFAGLAGLLTPEGTLIEANRASLELGGLEFADVAGKAYWDTHWWSYDADVQAVLKSAIDRAQRGETVRYDARVRARGADLIDVDFVLSPLADDSGRITNLIPSAFEITGRKQAEEQVRLVNRELQHRIANVFTVITSLLRLSGRHGRNVPDFVEATTQRLRALETAHRDTGGATGVQSADLKDLAKQVLRPWRDILGARLTIEGPSLALSRGQATAFGLIFHELATNAAKYGGLGETGGSVGLVWEQRDGIVRVHWREQGVGPVVAPSTTGFGLSVIDTLAESYLDGTVALDFAGDGLEVEIVASL